MKGIVWCACAAIIVTLYGFAAQSQLPTAEATSVNEMAITFEKSVQPIFKRKCLHCHGEQEPSGMLDMRTRASIIQGGETGAGLTPGNLKESLVWDKIRLDEMPPGPDKLTDAQKALIEQWIVAGAPDKDNKPIKKQRKDKKTASLERPQLLPSFQEPMQRHESAVQALLGKESKLRAGLAFSPLPKNGAISALDQDRIDTWGHHFFAP